MATQASWHLLLTLIAFSLAGGASNAQEFDPYQRGSHPTEHIDIDALFTLGLEENIDVWLPSDAGTYKVFYYIDGFGGVIPAVAYTQVMEHIASHGIVVVVLWKLTLPLNPNEKVPIFESVLDWAENHLEKKLHNKGISEDVHLDLENLVGGSHSAGSHVFVEYMKGTCGKFKGQVFMSPVDGVDPMGLIPIYCITPGQTLNYKTPTLLLAAGLDNIPGFSGYACAPKNLSNERFYDAQDPSSPRWLINATAFGHGDFLDPYYQETLEILDFCGSNLEASEDALGTYRRYIAGQTVSFIKALFSEKSECNEYLLYLEDTSYMIVETTQQHDNPSGMCPQASCSWTPLPTTTIAP